MLAAIGVMQEQDGSIRIKERLSLLLAELSQR